VVNAVLLKPLPYRQAERIVQLEDSYAGGSTTVTGPSEFRFWRRQAVTIYDVSAHWLDHLNLTGGSTPELISAAVVTRDFFQLYSAPALNGRTFTEDEERPNGGHVAILSYQLWRRRFAGDPAVVGKTISLGDTPYSVVGVLGQFDAEMFEQPPD